MPPRTSMPSGSDKRERWLRASRGRAISVDGKGVVLRGEDLREATAGGSERAQAAEALSKGEKRHAKRMAGRGGVHHRASGAAAGGGERVLAPQPQREEGKRPRPQHKRLWAIGEASRRGHRASPRRSSLAGSHGAQELGGAGRRPPESAQDAAPLFAPTGVGAPRSCWTSST